MKKKYLKKLNFLNRNISIKNYNNYLIYSYLNNYSLKLFFFFEKKNFSRLNKKLIKNLNSNIKDNFILKNSLLFLEKKNQNSYNWKNKFFYKNNINKLTVAANTKLITKPSEKMAIGGLIKNYIYSFKTLETNLNVFKELILFSFILNLLKVYEYYKVTIILNFLNNNK